MSVLLSEDLRVLVQGFTGHQGTYHAQACMQYGTNIVGGVSPGKGGMEHLDRPVFHTMQEAVDKTQANASIIFVPASMGKDALVEAITSGVELIVCITEGIPWWDMMEVKQLLATARVRLIGPNCPGIIVPGLAKLGIMPGEIHRPGVVGIISRSGTLTYEVVHQTTQVQLGQSVCIGIGGDPIVGTTFIDILPFLQEDPATKAIVLVGEIGGMSEEDAGDWIKAHCTKPVIGYIAGVSAPPGRRMGHAGAIVSQGKGTAESKIQALRQAGVHIVDNPAMIGKAVKDILR